MVTEDNPYIYMRRLVMLDDAERAAKRAELIARSGVTKEEFEQIEAEIIAEEIMQRPEIQRMMARRALAMLGADVMSDGLQLGPDPGDVGILSQEMTPDLWQQVRERLERELERSTDEEPT